MKKGIFLTVLLVLFLAGMAFAQTPSPTKTIHEQGLSPQQNAVHVLGPVSGACPNNDCIFYGGDGDPTSPNADGLWQNNSSAFGIDGRVYSPFVVFPKTGKCGGKCAWGIDGLFENIEYYPNQSVFGVPIAVDSVNWAIVSGVAAGGSPSTVTTVCSGNDTNFVLTPTGNIYFGTYEEDATSVHVAGCTIKGKGKTGTEYWEVVQPQTSSDGAFGFQLAYESGSPSNANAIGTPEPANDSWFWGPAFGISAFVNANTQGPGFVTFSAGVCATLTK